MFNIKERIHRWQDERERQAKERQAIDRMHMDCIELVRQYGETVMQNGMQRFYIALPGDSLRIDVTELDPEGLREYANKDNRLWYDHLTIDYNEGVAEGMRIRSVVDPYNELIHQYIKNEGDQRVHFYASGSEFQYQGLPETMSAYRDFLEQTVVPTLATYAETVNQSQQ